MQRRTNRLQVHREVLQDPHAAIFDDENIVKTNEMEVSIWLLLLMLLIICSLGAIIFLIFNMRWWSIDPLV